MISNAANVAGSHSEAGRGVANRLAVSMAVFARWDKNGTSRTFVSFLSLTGRPLQDRCGLEGVRGGLGGSGMKKLRDSRRSSIASSTASTAREEEDLLEVFGALEVSTMSWPLPVRSFTWPLTDGPLH